MSMFSIEQPLRRPRPASSTNTIRQKALIGEDSKICSKFIRLILNEKITCDHCEFKADDSMPDEQFDAMLEKCRAFDCMADVTPCQDYDCPKNIFYSKMKKMGHHENDMSRIARNCEFGITYFFGSITLGEVGALYGFTKERVRQVEEEALIKVGERIQRSEDLSHYIPDCGREHLLEIIAHKSANYQAHKDRMKEYRLRKNGR